MYPPLSLFSKLILPLSSERFWGPPGLQAEQLYLVSDGTVYLEPGLPLPHKPQRLYQDHLLLQLDQ